MCRNWRGTSQPPPAPPGEARVYRKPVWKSDTVVTSWCRAATVPFPLSDRKLRLRLCGKGRRLESGAEESFYKLEPDFLTKVWNCRKLNLFFLRTFEDHKYSLLTASELHFSFLLSFFPLGSVWKIVGIDTLNGKSETEFQLDVIQPSVIARGGACMFVIFGRCWYCNVVYWMDNAHISVARSLCAPPPHRLPLRVWSRTSSGFKLSCVKRSALGGFSRNVRAQFSCVL